jgi:hypothetical protein
MPGMPITLNPLWKENNMDKEISIETREIIQDLIELETEKIQGHYHPMWNKAKRNTVQELEALFKNYK